MQEAMVAAASLASNTDMTSDNDDMALPALRRIPVAGLSQLSVPELLIKTDNDVQLWRASRGYADYMLFLRRLSASVVGYELPYDGEPSTAVARSLNMLDELSSWIDDIPPLPTPQRFGNLAFRAWGTRLEQHADRVLAALLGPALAAAAPLVKPYLLLSFGSFVRMDYGTGHEAAFALLLCALALLGFLDQEREVALLVFPRYLRLVWRLQDVYRLEPAGSHGVWGLDDYSFLGYILGSAQLRDQDSIPPNAILHQPLPPTNLYFMQIARIYEFKTGPFYEHSSQLYSIATGVPNWGKVNKGLFKMYEAEVLGKRVVVQHIPLGGILEWNAGPRAVEDEAGVGETAASAATPAPWAASSTTMGGATAAPWVASSTTMGGPTAAPWATSVPARSAETGLSGWGARSMIPPPTGHWSATTR